MRISELIAELQDVLAEEGDIEARVGSYKLSEPAERVGVEVAPSEHGGFRYAEIGSNDEGPIW